MQWNKRRTLVVGITAAAMLVAGVAAIAADNPDEIDSDIERHGTFGEQATTAADSLGAKVYNVDPVAFAGSSETTVRHIGGSGRCLRASGATYAPLDIPHDSQISAAIADVRDDSGTAQVNVVIRRRTPGDPSIEDLFSGATGDTETPGRTTMVLDNLGASGGNTLNKNAETFFVMVQIFEETSDLEFCNLRVLYNQPDGGQEFHPVTPCAIFDTRPGHGGIERKLTAGEQIDVDSNLSDSSSQGGAAEDCGIPSATGSGFDNEVLASAVAVNLVAINPNDSGNLRAWAADASPPSGGVLVYNPGELNANELAINISSGSLFGGGNGGLMTIENNGPSTHVRAVVVGYYTPVDSRW